MSGNLVKAYNDGNGSSSTSLHSTRSCWISRWTNQGSLLSPHSQTFSKDEVFDHTQKHMKTNVSISRSNGAINNTTKAQMAGFDMGSLTLSAPLRLLGDSRNLENTHTTTKHNHFSNSDFISFNEGSRRREKYSAIFIPLHSDNNLEGMEIDFDARLYSKTTTHHVLTQHRGLKIQPLWSTTDSEKDNFGDTERSFDLPAETDTMDLFSLPNENNSSGKHFSPIAKSTMETDKTFPMAGVDPWEDKLKGKLAVTETPSTSRTQSMETEHLLSCSEQLSESRTFPYIDEESDCNRSVKRLKMSSSSSLDKTHMMMEHTKETSKDKNLVANGESSSLRTKKNPIFESFWIQRWCQDGSVEQERDPSKSVVVRGPDFDEVDKKRSPSVAAVAMMGKSVDGLHACTYTKRGPLVVWNSRDY